MKVISIVTTNHSLAFDDRVNKECKTLIEMGLGVNIIALESENKKSIGVTDYGADFITLQLFSRKYFRSGEMLPLKLFEWNVRILIILISKKWDVLWLNDFDGIGSLIYARFLKYFFSKKKIIWDHHELAPKSLIDSFIYRKLIHWSDVILHANEERVEFTTDKLPKRLHHKFYVVENYPGIDFMNAPSQNPDIDFEIWLKEDDYVIFQGAALTYRMVLECIAAIYETPDIKLVILGPCEDKVKNMIIDRWPEYAKKVFITGWTPQSNFYQYMDKALASLVFYENIDNNHWLCAPNRFYNAILRNVPVICGPNPPMKRIVEDLQVGVSCLNNGKDYVEIGRAIVLIRDQNEFFKNQCGKAKLKFVWPNQSNVFNEIYGVLTGKNR
jgi:hypothetical protein